MTAPSILNMNWITGQRELMEIPPERDIVEQLTDTMNLRNKLKRNELAWSRSQEKNACLFCKMAFTHHKNEKSAFDQLVVLASIQAGTQYEDVSLWQEEVEATRKTDYPL